MKDARSVLIAALFFLLCPVLLRAADIQIKNRVPDSAVTVDTSTVRFELTGASQGLLLRSVVDIAMGTEFIPQAGEGMSLWELEMLRNPERKLVRLQAQPGAKFEVARDDGGATVYRLDWSNLDLPDEPDVIDVNVTVIVPSEKQSFSYWYINVTNRSKIFGVWHVKFPRLERLGPVGKPEEDLFLDPQTQGRLTPNPYVNLPAGQSVHYPGYASFQMCAFYNPESAGLYYAAYDGNGYYKRFNFEPGEEGKSLDFYLEHSPENQGLPGTGYISPFPVVIGTFRGDWFTAAKIYRQWAEKQVWCSGGKFEKRGDIPDWYKKLAVWEFITANSYGQMHAYRQMLGVPWADHWNYIWKDPSQGDHNSPDLFPPRGGEEQMRTETAKLTEAGIYTVPYFLASALDVKSPQYTEWNMEKYLVRGGEARYALGNPDTPYIWIYPTAQFAWPCPYLDAWPDRAVEIIRHIMELGVTGIYLDTTTGNAYQCFSREHGHPSGGGNYWTQGSRRYLKRIRETVKSVNPLGIMTGENPCEIYVDLMDGFLLYVSHFPTHVPAFQAIYGDYIGTYGQFLSSPAKIGEDYPFMLPMGICFINGDQFGCTARTDYTMQQQGAKDMAWLRRLAYFRVKVVNRYVGLGEMLRAPKIENTLPQVSGWWWAWPEKPPWITRTVTRPAVIHSAWRASDGSVGIVFLNISEEPQQITFSIEGYQYGFPPGEDLTTRGLSLDKDENPVGEAYRTIKGGTGRIEHTLESRGMWALEITADEMRKELK